jgi:hypothetical protein
MEKNRRDFLKATGLSGAGLLIGHSSRGESEMENSSNIISKDDRKQVFNMTGYAAPAVETLRLGFIGLGNRGPGHLGNASLLAGVEIKALCDLRPTSIASAQKRMKGNHKPDIYTGGQDEWKKVCERKDIDVIYIATPWHLHTPMALYAMEHNKHVCVEIPAATTLKECWQLVETSERTKKHCVMLENNCYDFFELMTLNMARQGFFGEIVHGECAYIHDLFDMNFSKTVYQDMWRLRQNASRNGNLYPTHGLGPISQIMNINRGDKMEYLVSMSSDDFMMGAKAKELASTDDFYKPFADKKFRGNMNTSTIRTNSGRTIMLQHDVTSPRVYSRIHLVSGTKAAALKFPLPGKISIGHRDWLPENELKALEEKYQPAIVKKVGDLAKQVGGHGGKDFLMNWRTIDLMRNGLPMDMDVYDAALWSSMIPLSEASVSSRSKAMDVPDFTAGKWKSNKPVDTSLERGGTTEIKL